MIIVPIPKLSVKKECPNARTILDAVKSSNFGLNKKSKACIPLGSVSPRIMSTIKITKIAGIIIFVHFSIPPFTPCTMTKMVNAIKNICQMTGAKDPVINELNSEPDISGLPANLVNPPVRDMRVYFRVQPPTTP